MLSQYSWWDFVKVILLVAVPYYGYVLWKYYRQDIREWLTNRQRPVPPAESIGDGDDQGLYPVNDYTDDEALEPEASSATAATSSQPLQESLSQTSQTPDQWNNAWTESEEVDISGPAVATTDDIFGLPVAVAGENLQEQSVDEIISAAQRLTTNDQGALSPAHPDDKPAARIAKVLNNQLGHDILGDMPFKR
ncbi:hypothetical protein GCM10023189_32580 [Nibrella saemangeumensis]|uniref:Uncharacterized protein n=1 Tax=Nibrella saemangeumensis TaxID=1084526 RepID=A0ABP8N3G8_9BACT